MGLCELTLWHREDRFRLLEAALMMSPPGVKPGGLVPESGVWHSGVWHSGVWHSGVWHSGGLCNGVSQAARPKGVPQAAGPQKRSPACCQRNHVNPMRIWPGTVFRPVTAVTGGWHA